MGNWNMNIQGVGAHHNSANIHDANLLFKKFVEELRSVGHHVSHASFTFGAAEFHNEGGEQK